MVIEKLWENESWWNEKLLPRLNDINKEITEEVWKESFDIETLKILSKQRTLLMNSLKSAKITIDSKENKHIDELIEQWLNGTLPRKRIIKVLDDPKCEITHTIFTEWQPKRKKPSKSTLDIWYMPTNWMPEYDDMWDEYNELLENLREERNSISRKRAQEYRAQAWQSEMEWRKSLYKNRKPEKWENKWNTSIAEEIEREIIEDIQSSTNCDEVIQFRSWYKVRRWKKWWIYDFLTGTFKLKIEFDEIEETSVWYFEWYKVKKWWKRWVVEGEWSNILNIEYDELSYIAWWNKVKKGDKYWVFNYSRNEILKPIYDDIQQIDIWYKVKKDGKWGVCDYNGQEIIRPEYDDIKWIDRFWFKVKIGTKYWILNDSWTIIIKPLYDEIEKIWSRFKVTNHGKWWICKNNWKEIIEPKYDSVEPTNLWFIKVKLNNKWWLFNSEWHQKLSVDWDSIEFVWNLLVYKKWIECHYKEFKQNYI